MLPIKIKLLEGAKAPKYMTEGAAGADLFAYLPKGVVCLEPGTRKLISAGFCMELPIGYVADIRPRSGLSLKKGIMVLNSPGTIDSDYRGEVGVILYNTDTFPCCIENEMRIAQIVIHPITISEFTISESLGDTSRGTGGFGSTK